MYLGRLRDRYRPGARAGGGSGRLGFLEQEQERERGLWIKRPSKVTETNRIESMSVLARVANARYSFRY